MTQHKYPEYYNILQIPVTSSMDDIKAAYHRLAKKYHPDTNHGDKKSEDRLKEINEAYSILGNMAKRAEYDYLGKQHEIETWNNLHDKTDDSTIKNENKKPKNVRYVPLKVMIFRYIFILTVAIIYGIVLYNNRDKNNPYDVYAAFKNTSAKMNNFIYMTYDKLRNGDYMTRFKLYSWQYALRNNNTKLAEELFTLWPDCKIVDENGYSLLMKATNDDMIKILIDHGCDVNFVASDGETPYSIAVKRNDTKSINVLQKAGARIRWKIKKSAPTVRTGI